MAALNVLAETSASAGDLSGAQRCYRETLTLVTENGHGYRDLYAHALAGLGDVHAGLGERGQARDHWRRAWAIYGELGMPHADDMTARLDGPADPAEP